MSSSKHNIKFQSQILFLGLINVGSETFTFTNFDHAKQSQDLILKSVKPWIRPFCLIKFLEC